MGIVGGLSPEATSEFYLKLIEESRKYGNAYPHIVIDSIPINFSMEDKMIVHAKNQQRLLPFLVESVKRLQDADFIVIPCNTAHIFIGELRKHSNTLVISIVEEVVKEIKRYGYRKAGLLATSATVKSKIYSDKEIEFVSPSPKDQETLSEIIVKLIRNEITKKDKNKLQRIADKLREKADIVVLACTDLQRILNGNYLDSFEILIDAAVYRYLNIKSE